MSAAQTLWTEVLATALADAGVRVCVVSPGSRSTPLVTALARCQRLELPVVIDERAAAFYALSVARSSGQPTALLCTSGSAPGHYLPAVIEAAMANLPLVVLSADRPPEVHDAGASQTVAQLRMFGDQVRAQIDLGPPIGEVLPMRAVRRRVIQAVASACGPLPGPVHINVPLRKPLEPMAPSTEAERALAAEVQRIAAQPVATLAPTLHAPEAAIAQLAAALAAEPRGLIVVGAMPESFAAARAEMFELATRLGYPLLAEVGSQLRLGPRPAEVTAVDHGDLVLASRFAGATPPRLLLLLGAEPVAPGWHSAQPLLAGCARWVIGPRWQDPSSTARVVLGDPVATVHRLVAALRALPTARDPEVAMSWAAAERSAAAHLGAALEAVADNEATVLRAALHACARVAAARGPEAAPRLLLGNSLPVRVLDQVSGQVSGQTARPAHWLPVATQRGASGIDGMVAGAAGAAHDGRPVLAIIGDVTFAHDVGSLAVLAATRSPVVLMVIDNGGGRIFDHLPVARAELGDDVYARFFTTAPRLDPVAIARAFGIAARLVRDDAGASGGLIDAIADALTRPGATLLHVPVAADGALAVRTTALSGLQPPLRMVQGATS